LVEVDAYNYIESGKWREMKRLGLLVPILMIGTLVMPTAASAASTSTAPHAARSSDPAAIAISRNPVLIDARGRVHLAVWVRCDPGVQAFEIDASVTRPNASGSYSQTQANLTPCDGTWHPIRIKVPPSSGHFTPGRAEVTASVQFFSSEEGDFSADDTETVRLRPTSDS
jgi:hypothetical protein